MIFMPRTRLCGTPSENALTMRSLTSESSEAAGIGRRYGMAAGMSRTPIPTWYFALVVVRRGHRFLLTQEKKYGSTWSIPGGRAEAGEELGAAAIREVLEETGVPIRL